MFGGNKAQSKKSITKAGLKKGLPKSEIIAGGSGYGGHFRAVQGYKYLNNL